MTFDKLKRWLKGKRRQEAADRNPGTPAATDSGGKVRPPSSGSAPSRSRNADRSFSARDGGASGRTQGHKTHPRRPVSRQGIPILKPDEDLARCFLSSEGSPEKTEAGGATGGKPSAREGEGGVRRQRLAPAGRLRNRAGVRQLKGDEDLWRHFLSAAGEKRDAPPPQERSARADREPSPPVPAAHAAADRHGIPRLDDRVDLHRFFESMVQEDQEPDRLGEIFRKSLQDDARTLMKRKADGVWEPRRLTLKEQLRRYPAPQAQLDLHGATAPRARQRAESFIRTALADGLFTLRLIVGKGLHSEGGAVLPDVIEDLLLALKRENLILTYRWEKGVKRKSGAVIVYLHPGFEVS